jgi:polar amino acid transport system substrate-binding protein
MPRTIRLAALCLSVLFAAAACNASSSPAPSTGGSVPVPTVKPSGAPSTPTASEPAGTSTATETPAGSAEGSPGAGVPVDQLLFPGKLVVCSDIPYPPQEFFDSQGVPIGSDIEIAQEIANRLGLTAEIQNSFFDTIIAALKGGKCDMIISAQNITKARTKEVDMIPFFQAGQSFVVAKGNPAGIKVTDDLCGKTIAAESSTTEVDYLKGTNDYQGQGLTQACTSKGNAAIKVSTFTKDNDALLALQTAKVDAYFADSPVAGYYTVQNPDKFELSGLTLGVALEGISVKNDPAYKDLETAIQTTLVAMINDGGYAAILQKYGLESGAVTADVAGQLNKTK